jgi:hypothetical protein
LRKGAEGFGERTGGEASCCFERAAGVLGPEKVAGEEGRGCAGRRELFLLQAFTMLVRMMKPTDSVTYWNMSLKEPF